MEINEKTAERFELVQRTKDTLEAFKWLFNEMLKDETEECKKLDEIYGNNLLLFSQNQN